MLTLAAVQGSATAAGETALRPFFDGLLPMIGGDTFGAMRYQDRNDWKTLRTRLPARVGAAPIACIDFEPGTLRLAGESDGAADLDRWRCVLLAACRCVLQERAWGCFNAPELWYNRPRPSDEPWPGQNTARHSDLMFPRIYQRPTNGDLDGLVRRAVAESLAAKPGIGPESVVPIFKEDLWSEVAARKAILQGAQAAGVTRVAVWFQVEYARFRAPPWVQDLVRV